MISFEEMVDLFERQPGPSKLLLEVIRLGVLTCGYVDEALAPHGLVATEMELLSQLDRLPGSSEAEFAKQSGVVRQRVARIIRRLENEQLIRAGRHPSDTRAIGWWLTPDGANLLEDARRSLAYLERLLLDDLTSEQQEQLHQHFHVFATAVRTEEDRRFWKGIRQRFW